MQESKGETHDQRLAANMRALRERKDMSQAALAAAMSERGIPWHQQTVGRIEAGQQQVRFAEAVELAEVLKTSLDRLTWSTPEANATEFVYAAGTRVAKSYEEVAAAVARLLADLAWAERALADSADSKWARVREACTDTAARAAEMDLDAAVGEGIRRYEELPHTAEAAE